jgi:hypothetical protein
MPVPCATCPLLVHTRYAYDTVAHGSRVALPRVIVISPSSWRRRPLLLLLRASGGPGASLHRGLFEKHINHVCLSPPCARARLPCSPGVVIRPALVAVTPLTTRSLVASSASSGCRVRIAAPVAACPTCSRAAPQQAATASNGTVVSAQRPLHQARRELACVQDNLVLHWHGAIARRTSCKSSDAQVSSRWQRP